MTNIWTADLLARPGRLTHLPNFGTFHRLVVATPYLSWTDDVAIRMGDVLVRLVTGKIHGEKIEPIDQVHVDNNSVSLTGRGSGSATADGRFIEIVGPGDSPEDAEILTHSILGLIAMSLGPHSIGDVVFSEPYRASRDGQFGTLRIPVRAMIPRQTGRTELDVVHLLLPRLLSRGRSTRALLLALSWYERGLRLETPLDQLLSHFIAIETLVSYFAAENGPVPAAAGRQGRFEQLLKHLKAKVGPTEAQVRTQRLTDPTLNERFHFYAERRGLENEFEDDFRLLARLRNDVVHGSAAAVDVQKAKGAREIALRLLKAELGLPGEMSWENAPVVGNLSIEYTLVPGDDAKSWG